MVSSRCEWNFKDLAVAQSHKASRQRRGEGIFFLQLSLCMSPAESVAQIKGVYHHAWNWDLLYPRWSPAESVAQIKGVYHLAWNWDLLYPRWPWTPVHWYINHSGIHSHSTWRSPCQDPRKKLISLSLQIRMTGEPSNSGLYFIPDIVMLATRNSHYKSMVSIHSRILSICERKWNIQICSNLMDLKWFECVC